MNESPSGAQLREAARPSRESAGFAGLEAWLGQAWTSHEIPPTSRPLLREPHRAKRYRSRWMQDQRELARRALNLAVAGVSLLLLLPLLVIIAVVVKLSSPGPVVFVQERVGLNRRRRTGQQPLTLRGPSRPDLRRANAGGKLFKMYKFRTMYVAREETGQVWAQKKDPRITPVGRILRSFRLDELPQLWNVLLGHMNVVGPRPEQPEIFRKIRSDMADYSQRQRVLPGITGWAQINNGYDQTYRDVKLKLGYDLEYLERRSSVKDLQIMLKTIPVLLGRKVFFRG
jgi:lipopolysaccharide/colanic/teichoic acid biosynthesis glycosyltransferase